MTHKLAVMGNPVDHSLSPEIHQKFAALADIDLTYDKILVPVGAFAEMAEQFFAEGGCGLNVTVPHKDAAFQFAAQYSVEADLAKAVNTLRLVAESTPEWEGDSSSAKHVRGENTDGVGLLRDIKDNLGWKVSDQRILILGAGGAVQGVLKNLIEEQPEAIVIANRTLRRADDLVNHFNDHLSLSEIDQSPAQGTQGPVLSAVSLDRLSESPPFDLIISASSAGLSDGLQIPKGLEENLLHEMTCCYDMIYGKATPFLQWAKRVPADQRSDGLGMLVEQAAKSFEFWFDRKVSTQSVLSDLRLMLSRNRED